MKSISSKIFLAALLTCSVHLNYSAQAPAQQKILNCQVVLLTSSTDERRAIFRSPSGESVFVAEKLNKEATELALANAIHYHFDVTQNQVRACASDPAALAVWKDSRAAAKATSARR